MEVSNLFVCLIGMGVTFIGLTCLILLSESVLRRRMDHLAEKDTLREKPLPARLFCLK